MKVKDAISKATAGIILFFFWLFAGVFCSPGWLIITIVGGLLQTYEWKEAPRIFWGFVTVEWLWN